jgi:hypothetical protein
MVARMGGIGSGRCSGIRSPTVNNYHSIDLTVLNRRNIFHRGYSGTLSWSRGGMQTGWVRYAVVDAGLRLNYKTRRRAEDGWDTVDELIPFDWTPTQYGGKRRWFVCLSCASRCRIIYGGSLFRCRLCYRLKYRTQYEQPYERAITGAQKIRRRLGGHRDLTAPFPSKPKGMHWQTYWRLEAREERYQYLWAELVFKWLRATGRWPNNS